MVEERFKTMTTKKLVDYVEKIYHEPIKIFFTEVTPHVNIVSKKYSGLDKLQESFVLFKRNIINHINREEVIIFPAIIEYEEIYERKEDMLLTSSEIEKIINQADMKNDHKRFEDFIDKTLESLKSVEGQGDFSLDFVINGFEKFKRDIQKHWELENETLYPRWTELQQELRKMI